MKKQLLRTLTAALFLTLVLAGRAPAEWIPPAGGGQQIGPVAVVLCESLTLRESPGTSSKAVGTLRYGDRVMVLTESDGFAQCCVSDDVDASPAGWANADYLAVDPAWYRTEEATPVYAWNDASAPRVALLSKNTTLPVLKRDGSWLVVSLRGAAGWIYAKDVK